MTEKEMEPEVVVDTTQEEHVENVENVDDEENNDDVGEITYEQALEWKTKAERLEKAEKKLVELKKQNKENKGAISSKEEIRQILAEEKFYEKNPEAEQYRDKIEIYKQKGLSLDESYLLASKSDVEVENNRDIYSKGIVRGNQKATEGVKMVSVGEFDKMTLSEQNDYLASHKKKYGSVKFK